MFPFDLDDDEIDVEQREEKEPRDYEIDFKTEKLTGKIITGKKAIEQWIIIVLSTDRYFYTQYSWDHGSELNTLIGQNAKQDYVESEVKRMIEDALSVNENITGIENLDCTIEGDKLMASFTAQTVYGEVDINV